VGKGLLVVVVMVKNTLCLLRKFGGEALGIRKEVREVKERIVSQLVYGVYFSS